MITAAGAVLAGIAIQAPLASALDPVTHMMRALSTSSSTTSPCLGESQACAVDEACRECSELYASQVDGCIQAVAGGTDPCAALEGVFCCASEGCDSTVYADLLSESGLVKRKL